MTIVVRDLSKAYGALRAVRGVGFDIPRGTIVGLLGPNGAGKTTILRMLTTFLRPDSGSVEVAGFDTATQETEVRRRLGYLPEGLPIYPEARVSEYLDYRARLKGITSKSRKLEIDRCLQSCQLETVRHRLLGKLSQGYRRRVGLADALLGDPAVLILDEPTVGLDPLQVRHTRQLLNEIHPDKTILMSTHLLAEAESICQRVLILKQGELVSDIQLSDLGGVSEIIVEIRGLAADIGAMLQSLPEVQRVDLTGEDSNWHRFLLHCSLEVDVREQIVEECQRRSWPLRELSSASLSLEDHFVRTALLQRREAA